MIKKHYLFVCIANRQRSPTGERVLQDMLVETGHKVWGINAVMDSDYEVCSAGTNADEADGRTDMSHELGEGMDVIFTMDNNLLEELVKVYRVSREKIVNLDIPDNYERDSPELVRIFREKLKQYVPSKAKL